MLENLTDKQKNILWGISGAILLVLLVIGLYYGIDSTIKRYKMKQQRNEKNNEPSYPDPPADGS